MVPMMTAGFLLIYKWDKCLKMTYCLLHVPPNPKLQRYDLHDCPYFLLGDEILSLKKWLMRPFPGKTADEEKRTYNYRHTRARRIIQNYFGILSARFCILQKPIRASVENVENYVLACLALHNYLRLTMLILRITHLLVLSIWKINMETLYQENRDHKMKIQFSVIAFKVSMLFEVPDHVLMR